MQNTVILVTKPYLGSVESGDAEFGAEMLDKFFHTLESRKERPTAICFYTEGVKALAVGSPLETGLRLLQGLGVKLAVCGSCADRYGVADKLAVGEIVGMPGIVEWMAQAEKVITI
ncbi:MAG: DsrE family protein [Planctomycetales bacterium]|nr:DsrE family protein [Planctomycetales bacterium]